MKTLAIILPSPSTMMQSRPSRRRAGDEAQTLSNEYPMKSHPLFLLLLAAVLCNCTPKTSSEAVTTDSTAVQQTSTNDAVPVSSSAYQPPKEIRNFPDYSYETLLTNDERESDITQAVDELISSHNDLSLLRYSTYYKRQRDYNGDYGDVTETTEETDTWFFDRDFKLRAYTNKHYREGEGRNTRVLVILYADSIIAVSDYEVDDGQIGLSHHTKLLASKCPKCGVKTDQEAGSEGKVTATLTRDDLMEYRLEDRDIVKIVNYDVNDVMAKAERSGDTYLASVNLESWTDGNNVYQNPYTVDYSIDKDLYTYVQFRNFIELFQSADQPIASTDADLYLNGSEEGTSYRTLSMLEDETVYFLLYTKFKMAGGGIEECYAMTMTKGGEVMSNVLIGSAYEVSGPEAPGEDYSYEYDSEKKILAVTQVRIKPRDNADEERTETKFDFKLKKDGTIGEPILRN
jgi:hypothetical protein